MAHDRAADAAVARSEWRLLSLRLWFDAVVVAEGADRTYLAPRSLRVADRRADIHERVMPSRGFALRPEARVELDGLAIGGGATKDCPAEHAADVRVGETRRLVEREARHCGRRVRPNARQRIEAGYGARQERVRPRDTVQVTRAAVVPEARPLAQHLTERRAGKRAKRREPPQEASVRGKN